MANEFVMYRNYFESTSPHALIKASYKARPSSRKYLHTLVLPSAWFSIISQSNYMNTLSHLKDSKIEIQALSNFFTNQSVEFLGTNHFVCFPFWSFADPISVVEVVDDIFRGRSSNHENSEGSRWRISQHVLPWSVSFSPFLKKRWG